MMADLTENYQLKWHSFGSHLHSCVSASLQKDTFSDVCLYTFDGHQILAHRFVLSASSQYLHEVLKLQQQVSTSLPLIIILPPEINYKTMRTLVQYMYSGETTVSKDILENVLRGGDLLKIKGLWRPKEDKIPDKKTAESDLCKSKTPKIKLLNFTTPIKTLHIVNQIEKVDKINLENKNKTEEVKEKPCSDSKDTQIQDNSKLTENKTLNETPKITNLDENDASITTSPKSTTPQCEASTSTSTNNMQFLVIKEEPIEWNEINSGEMEMVDETEMFDDEMTIKPEVVLDDSNDKPEELYSPLTCELCSETFTLPAEWVRHIQTHTDMLPAKRQRRGKSSEDDNNATFPPLNCDMCQKHFPTPAEWVRHIQSAHTEFELRASNKTNPTKPKPRQLGSYHKICSICNKKFPSHASMLIHKRTHTGEKPYMCEHCQKGFNVKSNLLRHLRTLHDRIINSTEVEFKEKHSVGTST